MPRIDFHVTMCKAGTFISVAHLGSLDLQKHVDTEKHKDSIRNASSKWELTTHFVKKDTGFQSKVEAAEATLAYHTVVHHSSYKTMDCISKLNSKLFSDSEIAKEVSCARTKAGAIVNGVIGPHAINSAVAAINENDVAYFGVCTDGSNHGNIKMFPEVIQYFNHTQGGLQTNLIDLQSVKDETAETISTLITDSLHTKGILNKCVAFGSDNCNTNFGGVQEKMFSPI